MISNSKTSKFSRNVKKLLSGIFCLLLLLGYNVPMTNAEVIFEDKFEDETSLNNWTTVSGTMIANGTLISEGCTINCYGFTASNLRGNSSSILGTWSFDLYYPDAKYDSEDASSFFIFYFMGYGAVPPYELWPDPGYSLNIWPDGIIHFASYRDDSVTLYKEKIVGRDAILGWHHYTVTRDDSKTMKAYYDGEELFTLEGDSYVDIVDHSEYIYLSMPVGMQLDNLVISGSVDYAGIPPVESDFPLSTVIFIMGFATVIGVISYGRRIYSRDKLQRVMNLKKKHGTKFLQHMDQTVKIQYLAKEVDITEGILLSILTQKEDSNPNYLKELKNSIPLALLAKDFKYLLQPVRMMILKVLASEFRMTSKDLQEILEVSRSEFSAHKKSLISNGFIQTTKTLTTKGVTQFLYLTKKGKASHQLLSELLQDYISYSSPYLYLIKAQSMIKDDIGELEELYPSK